MSKRICSEPGCERDLHCVGLCRAHYSRKRRGVDMSAPIRDKVVRHPEQVCSAIACTKKATASHGLCWGHYYRVRRYGDVNTPHQPTGRGPQPKKSCRVEGCGRVANRGTLCSRCSSAWRRKNNPNLCSVKGCEGRVHASGHCGKHYIRIAKFGDPDGTAYSTSCPQGHEYTPANESASTRRRICMACHRDKQARRRANRFDDDAELIRTSELMDRDGWVCQICHLDIPRSTHWPDPMFGSIDHVVALTNGGRHNWENVQAAHLRCNMRKGGRDAIDCSPEEFQIALQDTDSAPIRTDRRYGRSKLTADDVSKIRQMMRDGVMHMDIAPMFGVSKGCISLISRGITWSSVA